jgi:hypothetical protein
MYYEDDESRLQISHPATDRNLLLDLQILKCLMCEIDFPQNSAALRTWFWPKREQTVYT